MECASNKQLAEDSWSEGHMYKFAWELPFPAIRGQCCCVVDYSKFSPSRLMCLIKIHNQWQTKCVCGTKSSLGGWNAVSSCRAVQCCRCPPRLQHRSRETLSLPQFTFPLPAHLSSLQGLVWRNILYGVRMLHTHTSMHRETRDYSIIRVALVQLGGFQNNKKMKINGCVKGM